MKHANFADAYTYSLHKNTGRYAHPHVRRMLAYMAKHWWAGPSQHLNHEVLHVHLVDTNAARCHCQPRQPEAHWRGCAIAD